LQGGTPEEVAAAEGGDLAAPGFTAKEAALFEFLRKNTLAPADVIDDDLSPVRAAGWTDPEIAEAVYVTAFFAMMNRVADAFGI
jgi:alkylhydroperoxidase family enzyme